MTRDMSPEAAEERADAAESALRQVREDLTALANDPDGCETTDDGLTYWVEAERVRAILDSTRVGAADKPINPGAEIIGSEPVGAADTQPEGAGAFERMLADPHEQFDVDGEVAKVILAGREPSWPAHLVGSDAVSDMRMEAWQSGECGYPIEEPVQTTTASAVTPKPSTWIADLCGLPRGHAGDHVKRSDLPTPTAGSQVDAAPERETPRPICPECEEGKHGNCDGSAWNDRADDIDACRCPDPSHQKENRS